MDATKDFLADHHVVAGLYPVANTFANGVSTDIINMENYRRCTFVVSTGAIEDNGISNLVTVDACDNTTPSNTTAMAFTYRVCLSSTTVDTWGALTTATSSGYNFAVNNAVANAIWLVEITSAEIESAAAGYEYVRLTIAETVDKTVTASCIAILSDPRYPQGVPITAIS